MYYKALQYADLVISNKDEIIKKANAKCTKYGGRKFKLYPKWQYRVSAIQKLQKKLDELMINKTITLSTNSYKINTYSNDQTQREFITNIPFHKIQQNDRLSLNINSITFNFWDNVFGISFPDDDSFIRFKEIRSWKLAQYSYNTTITTDTYNIYNNQYHIVCFLPNRTKQKNKKQNNEIDAICHKCLYMIKQLQDTIQKMKFEGIDIVPIYEPTPTMINSVEKESKS